MLHRVLLLASGCFVAANVLEHQVQASVFSLPSHSQTPIPANPLAMAQAGNAGGVVGNANKSLSGAEETAKSGAAATKDPKRTAIGTRGDDSGQTNEGNCARGILGFKWSSWASGLFGKGDTTFNADGTAMHGSGIPGTWRCNGNRFVLKWAIDSNLYPYAVSPDGRRMIDPNNGKVGFTRQ
jgi:hypothetical protein